MKFRMTRTRLAALAQVAKHGTVFEREAMSRVVAVQLMRAGYVSRCPGYGRRLTTVTITDAGKAVSFGVPCECYRCTKERGELEVDWRVKALAEKSGAP